MVPESLAAQQIVCVCVCVCVCVFVHGPFIESLLNLLQYCFCFMFYFFFARKHTGSYFPDQGSNLHCRLHWKGKASPLDRQGSPYSTDFTEDLRKDHFVCRDGQRWIYRRNNEEESIVI